MNGVILTIASLMKFPRLAATCWRNFTRSRRLQSIPCQLCRLVVSMWYFWVILYNTPQYWIARCIPICYCPMTLSNTITDKPDGRRTVSERDIQCKVGRALWLQVNKVFFLTQQMRNKDHDFMEMQRRLRVGEFNAASSIFRSAFCSLRISSMNRTIMKCWWVVWLSLERRSNHCEKIHGIQRQC